MGLVVIGSLILGWHDGLKKIFARLFVSKPAMASRGKGFLPELVLCCLLTDNFIALYALLECYVTNT